MASAPAVGKHDTDCVQRALNLIHLRFTCTSASLLNLKYKRNHFNVDWFLPVFLLLLKLNLVWIVAKDLSQPVKVV